MPKQTEILSAAAGQRTMDGAAWAMLVLLATLWGGSFFFAEVALEAVPPLTLALCRVALAAAVLLTVCRWRGVALRWPVRLVAAFLVMGGLNNLIPFSLIFWGQTHIAGGLAAILNATTPFFTAILAHLLTRDERLTAGKVAGILIGIVGVAVMIGPHAWSGIGTNLLAQGAVLGGALSYACAGIFGRRFAGLPPLQVAAGQLSASTLMLLPLALWLDRSWKLPWPPLEATAAIAALAVVSTALAYVLYFRILARAGATNLLLVTMLIPVTAILLGTLILGERLAGDEIAGMAIIALGLAQIDGRVWRWLRRRATAPSAAPPDPS